MRLTAILLGICMSVMPLLATQGNNINYNNKNYSTEAYSSKFEISKNCYGAISKEKLDEVTRAASRNDKEAVATLILNGYVGILTKGTRVEIISGGLVVKQVQVISGAYKGVYLYVPSDCIQSCK